MKSKGIIFWINKTSNFIFLLVRRMIEKKILDTNAGKQLSLAATDV